MKFAIIETGGKQYKVSAGQKIKVEKIKNVKPGEEVKFENVLLISDGKEVKIGSPYLSGTAVSGKVLDVRKDSKKIVFRYHSKNRYRKKKGHRQWLAEVEISSV